jgi:hypothetical protein
MNFLAPGMGHEGISKERPASGPARLISPSRSAAIVWNAAPDAPDDLSRGALLTVPAAVRRMRGMFLEMPGTQLSIADGSRLVGLPPALCSQVLDTLVEAGFLKRTPHGAYTVNTGT